MRVRYKRLTKEEEMVKNSNRGRPQSHRMESIREKEFQNAEDWRKNVVMSIRTEATQRQQTQTEAESHLPHEADAIFTELQDQLISLKDQLISKTLRTLQTKKHVPSDVITNQSIKSFEHLCRQFTRVSRYFIEGSGGNIDCDQKMKMRVCEEDLENIDHLPFGEQFC